MGRHSTCHPACRFKNTHISTKHCKVSVVQRRLLLTSQGDESNDTPSLELSPSDGATECRYLASRRPFASSALRFVSVGWSLSVLALTVLVSEQVRSALLPQESAALEAIQAPEL